MLAELSAVLDRVCETDPAVLADGGSVEALHRCLARLEAATTRATAAFDAGGEWAATGARSTAAWLSVHAGLPKGTAGWRVRTGRGLRHLPVTEQAWLAGDIGSAQVSALVGSRRPATEAALARDEEMLVGQARRLRHSSFLRVLAYWGHHADPDSTEGGSDRRRAGRRFCLSRSFGGAWLGDLVLDPIDGAVLSNQVGRIETELFDTDWAEARSRLGERALAGRPCPHACPTSRRRPGGDGPEGQHGPGARA